MSVGSYRGAAALKNEYFAPMVRRLRAMLSWRRIDTAESDGDAVTCLGREDETGTVETDKMDMLSPVGLIARPEDNATVQVLTAYIGGAGDHPVAVGTLDHTRRAVISTVGLKADETLIYTSALVIKLTADGTIELCSTGGTPVPLATKADVDAVNARVSSLQAAYNAHVHVAGALVAPGGGGAVTGSTGTTTANNASATVNGTTVVLAE